MSCYKLRIVLRNLWEYAQLPGGLVGILHSAADHLLKQVLFYLFFCFEKKRQFSGPFALAKRIIALHSII